MDGKDKYWYHENDGDVVWWLDNRDRIGECVFSFDKKTEFNLFRDYPHKLTSEQKEMFDKENPFWADFFKSRSEN